MVHCCFIATCFMMTTGWKCSQAVKACRCISIPFLKASLTLKIDKPSGPLSAKPVQLLIHSDALSMSVALMLSLEHKLILLSDFLGLLSIPLFTVVFSVASSINLSLPVLFFCLQMIISFYPVFMVYFIWTFLCHFFLIHHETFLATVPYQFCRIYVIDLEERGHVVV